MITFGQSVSATRFAIEDANIGRTWKNYQVRQAINFALSQVWGKMTRINKGWFETSTGFALTAGQETYVLPSRVGRIISVEYIQGATVTPLQRAWVEDRFRFQDGSGMQAGEPRYYYIRGDNLIGLLPVPNEDAAYDTASEGPIRINYVEKPRNVETLDPTYGLYDELYDPATQSPELFFGVIGNAQGPFVRAQFDNISGGGDWPNQNLSYEVFSFFSMRDRDGSDLSVPLHRSPVGVGSHLQYLDIATAMEPILQITRVPAADEWPSDATHLDIWMRGNNRLELNAATVSHMYWLTTIRKDEADSFTTIDVPYYDDGTGGFEIAGRRPRGGETQPLILYGQQLDEFNGYVSGSWTGFSNLLEQRVRNLFPKSPFDRSSFYAPLGTRTGSAIYTDTNPCYNDADFAHPELSEEFLEVIAVRAALILNLRHGIENRALALRWAELEPEFKEMVASRDMSPRRVVVTNPDPSNRTQRAAVRTPNLRG